MNSLSVAYKFDRLHCRHFYGTTNMHPPSKMAHAFHQKDISLAHYIGSVILYNCVGEKKYLVPISWASVCNYVGLHYLHFPSSVCSRWNKTWMPCTTTTEGSSSQLPKCLVKSKPLASDFCENYQWCNLAGQDLDVYRCMDIDIAYNKNSSQLLSLPCSVRHTAHHGCT